jgi:hypothetical protein
MFCRRCGEQNPDTAASCARCGGALQPVVAPAAGPAATVGTPLPASQAVSNIVVDILFSLVTCGIYNLFWNARQFGALNAFLGEERFAFWKWLLLSIVTCGIYNVYNEYLVGVAIVEVQRNANRPVAANLPLLCVVISIFGLSVVADAIQQHEINKLYR